jgi:hypothetical protein
VAVATLAGSVGLVLLFVGGSMLLDSSRGDRRAFIEGLPALMDAPPGTVGLVEGRILDSVPSLHEEFVAYVRERYGTVAGDTLGWIVMGGQTQPLVIGNRSGQFRVTNADYALDRAFEAWTPHRRLESGPTMTEGAIRLEGLVAGGTVMVVGRSPAGGDPRDIVAESIAGVDRQTYLRELADLAATDRSAAPWLLAAGAALVLFALWLLAPPVRFGRRRGPR